MRPKTLCSLEQPTSQLEMTENVGRRLQGTHASTICMKNFPGKASITDTPSPMVHTPVLRREQQHLCLHACRYAGLTVHGGKAEVTTEERLQDLQSVGNALPKATDAAAREAQQSSPDGMRILVPAEFKYWNCQQLYQQMHTTHSLC